MCYYIVPAGLDIIFQDEDGNEITRWVTSVVLNFEESSDVICALVEWAGPSGAREWHKTLPPVPPLAKMYHLWSRMSLAMSSFGK